MFSGAPEAASGADVSGVTRVKAPPRWGDSLRDNFNKFDDTQLLR